MRISSNVHNAMVRDIVVRLFKRGIISHTFSISKSKILTGCWNAEEGKKNTHTHMQHTITQIYTQTSTCWMIRIINTDVEVPLMYHECFHLPHHA